VKGDLLRRDELSESATAEMYSLFCSQFENVPLEQFVSDLDEKNWVLLLRNDNGELAAFSSMHVYETTLNERKMTLLYSGDTAVDSATWNDSALSYNLMGAFNWLRRHYDCETLHWFLLVSGYRTYRLLPVFSDIFYPRFDRETPDNVRSLMHSILKEGYRGIPENRLGDPNIAFFAERNPGHLQGDELVCFCELAEEKLTRLGKRMWRKGQMLFADHV
jgi:hypothetical protein